MDHEGCEILNHWPPYIEQFGCADLSELVYKGLGIGY